eukprot:3157560-Rhodomonas_salina.1
MKLSFVSTRPCLVLCGLVDARLFPAPWGCGWLSRDTNTCHHWQARLEGQLEKLRADSALKLQQQLEAERGRLALQLQARDRT